MKVSFPYMGCVTAYKKLLEGMGHTVVMPNKPTQSTIDIGVKYSPEFICFPFKVMLGTYIECAKKGIELILTSGGCGPCRAGFYSELHERILKKLGYNIQIITFDSLFADPKIFFKKLNMARNKTNIFKLARLMLFTVKLLFQMDGFEKELKIIRAYEQRSGDTNIAYKKILDLYDKCKTFKDLKIAKAKSRQLFDNVKKYEVSPENRMRVGIIGEIYVVMESSVNMDIEQKLNSMGIEVENEQYISHWLLHNIQPKWFKFGKFHRKMEKAKKYVKVNCGGHDMENIACVIDFNERGFDGVAHLMPFGCLPELVNLSLIPNITKELGIRILSLSLDEQMGMANNTTRIEAFVDLIKNKRDITRLSNKEKNITSIIDCERVKV